MIANDTTASLEDGLIAPHCGTHERRLPALVVTGDEVGRPGGVGHVEGDVRAQVQDQADPPVLTDDRHRELLEGRHGALGRARFNTLLINIAKILPEKPNFSPF